MLGVEARRGETIRTQSTQKGAFRRIWHMLISTAYALGAMHTARAYAHALTECERRRILFRSTFDRRDPPDM